MGYLVKLSGSENKTKPCEGNEEEIGGVKEINIGRELECIVFMFKMSMNILLIKIYE